MFILWVYQAITWIIEFFTVMQNILPSTARKTSLNTGRVTFCPGHKAYQHHAGIQKIVSTVKQTDIGKHINHQEAACLPVSHTRQPLYGH